MNQKLIKLNNNRGLVTDENGNISLISKENDSYDFKEILLKDNDLEELNLKLDMAKKQLAKNKEKTLYNNIMSFYEVFTLILLYKFSRSIAVLVSSYLFVKILTIFLYGTRIGRHNNKKKLTTDIEKMKLEIQTLEKELTEIKEKSKYKVNVSTIYEDKIKTSIEETYTEMSLPIISEENTKVRVLSLSKRK